MQSAEPPDSDSPGQPLSRIERWVGRAAMLSLSTVLVTLLVSISFSPQTSNHTTHEQEPRCLAILPVFAQDYSRLA